MTKEILDQARGDLRKVEEDFKKQLSRFRTGRASVSILDGIHVDYYGVSTPINQLATLGVPEANLIIIQPWDNKIINDVDKAIRAANLNLNPVSDGKVIKLPIPPLDQQRRLEIIKTLRKYTEERRAQLRNVRRDYRDMIKSVKDDREISEDDEKRAYDELQKLVDAANASVDQIEKDKEKHILED
ncbi:MAG TPA: ribosome recycling factor [Candidatus Aminicenantes bacterium]|nr:ribosome recycling factor [Candidatus Aminicenantes bacterium]